MNQNWKELSEEKLLELRICDLKLSFEDSDLAPLTQKLYQELEAKGIALRPKFYFGDEWFSPEETTLIAIPFFLADTKLKNLEKKLMLDVGRRQRRRVHETPKT